MLWHIVKRELFEQMSSLRFAFAMFLTVSLDDRQCLGLHR